MSPQVAPAAHTGGRNTSDEGHQARATAGDAGRERVSGTPVSAARSAASGPLPDHGEPASATLAEGGAELYAVAYADGLDGAERKVLLHHIAQAWPEVIAAGAELVAQWRAECAEERRKNLRRRESDRRRRRRGEAGRQA